MNKRTFLKLVEYQTEQSEQHLNEVRSIHREMRGYKHDFHHHLQMLKGQLEAGETKRALQYIEELDYEITHMDTLLKTGNLAADVILSAKLSQAKENSITVTVKAVLPEQLLLTDVELSIILGNYLENAIEACKALPAGERFIRLYITLKGNMLYFSMLNSSGRKLEKEGGLFASKKSGIHGFGLKRAEAILEKHGGWCKYNSEDGAFSTEFLVPAVKE